MIALIERGRQNHERLVDSLIDHLSRIWGRVTERPLRSAIYTGLVSTVGLIPDSTALPLNTVLNNQNIPEEAGAEGKFTTRNLLINTADAAVNNRVLLPLTARDPIPTPTPPPTATPERTPNPITTPETRVCSPWDPDVANMLRQIPVLPEICFVQVTDSNRNTVPCGQGGACYHAPTRTAYIERGSPFGGIRHAQAHEVCHGHQHRSILDAGLGEPNPNLQSWLDVPEGSDFQRAVNQVLAEHRSAGLRLPWDNFGTNLIEDFANICPPWYISFNQEGITPWSALVNFAQRWLPKATLTPTPEPTATPDTRVCTPWPAEMSQEISQLPILERTCFAHYTDRSQIPYPDIYEMFTSDGSGNADVLRRLVHVLASDRVQREWFILIVGHETGHFHQAEQSRLNGMDPDARPNFQQAYLNTQEGREFVAASNAVIEYARSRGTDISSPFMHNPFGADNYEDAADVISYWFNRRSALDGEVWSQMRGWATRWLRR